MTDFRAHVDVAAFPLEVAGVVVILCGVLVATFAFVRDAGTFAAQQPIDP